MNYFGIWGDEIIYVHHHGVTISAPARGVCRAGGEVPPEAKNLDKRAYTFAQNVRLIHSSYPIAGVSPTRLEIHAETAAQNYSTINT